MTMDNRSPLTLTLSPKEGEGQDFSPLSPGGERALQEERQRRQNLPSPPTRRRGDTATGGALCRALSPKASALCAEISSPHTQGVPGERTPRPWRGTR